VQRGTGRRWPQGVCFFPDSRLPRFVYVPRWEPESGKNFRHIEIIEHLALPLKMCPPGPKAEHLASHWMGPGVN
jgi:hypothetical protein